MPSLRRSALLAAAAAVTLPLLVSTAAAETAPTTASRTVLTPYSRAGGVASTVVDPVLLSPGEAQAATGLEDRARVSASDGSGRMVAIDVEWTPSGSDVATSHVYCGASPTLSIAHDSTVRVTPVAGTCLDGTTSLPTSGSISMVFTRPVAPPTIGPQDRWAVLIGIQDYAGKVHSTYGARGDVSAIRTSLLRSGWRSDHILTILDAQASGPAILDAMAWLADHSGPRTFSLFHFSGHVCISSRGSCPSGHTYLWSYETRFIPETTVGAILGRVDGRAWFDFAGCESGAFDVGLHSDKRLFTGSSQPSETSYEEPSWHESVWGGLVWDRAFLRGDAGWAPGKATIGQMVDYGKVQAPHVTADQQAGAQHPVVVGGDPTQSLYAPRP